MSDIHISIKAEKIAEFGNFEFTNAMLGSTIILAILIILGVIVQASIKKEGKPSKIQLAVESFYQVLDDIVVQSLGFKSARKYVGLVIVLFLYIVLGSWFGLIPGVLNIGFYEHDTFVPFTRAPTTDLNATTALAIIAFLTVQYSGFSSLGFFGYLSKFFTLKGGAMGTVLGLFELISEFVRLISWSFRLFGNIFAGEVLIVVLSSLTKFSGSDGSILNYIGVPVPSLIIMLEFLVAIIQAYVFVNLMTVFVSMAAEPAHHDNHKPKKSMTEQVQPIVNNS